MTVRVDVAPDLFLWAVERAGWDEQTLARRFPQFGEWVDGTRRPTLKQLQGFADATHTPFGMLFLDEPPVEEVPIPDMRTIRNTAVFQPSADLLDTIYLCQARQDWYREYARNNDANGPQFVRSVTTDTDPAAVAHEIRSLLGFTLRERTQFSTWKEAFRGLISRIEEVGVLVMVNGVVGSNTHRALNPQEFRGFALSDPLAPLIFVNGADTKAAQIFTLIHELGHIWLGHSALSDAAMKVRTGPAEEMWCNTVAAEVLVPLEALREDFRGKASSEELDRLARRYKASTLVVLKRLYDAHFLSWDDYRNRYDEEFGRVMRILQARGSSGGNFYYTQPLRVGREFARAVIASTLEGATTYRDAYDLLGTKSHSTFETLAQEIGVA
ncbi:MAG: ImmA/IrrE family metallo-endopeptidase [Actinomyces sp.]|nr:ImmA/IrrE family metallo-endopeptidase [Actinomyces sp.]